ncbi:pyridoxine 5'-phosphate synthase [Leptospira kanakyensis]|uniref:Pyridoxine 5'-phosphate synthase n=2 Tax=Leptospira kanakyensis TaxID=2484968 RepID=A0A6N4QDJ6_9LEPT|nr:pyridoxine 5'-phosphate synthase [Leptospira kanakyensis]TGK63610.1 pyridoxine 5'-phosphate synthase [Leptospira kanakyensis]TGK69926.1 pyridoxine 5'-phosphate synthase [Leptospira kanakyensis]
MESFFFPMTQLSVNVNKIATLRNSRGGSIPSVILISGIILDAGAYGITIHPREDERHITKQDVFEIQNFLKSYNEKKIKNGSPKKEFNIEGEPSDRFLNLVLAAKPDQATLVPVKPGEITSDHGFDLKNKTVFQTLKPMVERLNKEGIRVSLFMETDFEQYPLVKELGADRIELYTGPFAHAYDKSPEDGAKSFQSYELAAKEAHKLGLGVNAGHDLDTNNLKLFAQLPHLAEVSIGHRLVSQSLVDGMEKTIGDYLKVLSIGNEV